MPLPFERFSFPILPRKEAVLAWASGYLTRRGISMQSFVVLFSYRYWAKCVSSERT